MGPEKHSNLIKNTTKIKGLVELVGLNSHGNTYISGVMANVMICFLFAQDGWVWNCPKDIPNLLGLFINFYHHPEIYYEWQLLL